MTSQYFLNKMAALKQCLAIRVFFSYIHTFGTQLQYLCLLNSKKSKYRTILYSENGHTWITMTKWGSSDRGNIFSKDWWCLVLESMPQTFTKWCVCSHGLKARFLGGPDYNPYGYLGLKYRTNKMSLPGDSRPKSACKHLCLVNRYFKIIKSYIEWENTANKWVKTS